MYSFRTFVVSLVLVAVVTLSGCSGILGSNPVYEAPLDDGSEIAAQHTAALDSAGSYEVNTYVQVESGGTGLGTTSTATVDRSNEQVFYESGTTQLFVDGDTAVERRRTDSGVEYAARTGDSSTVDHYTHSETIQQVANAFEFTYDDTAAAEDVTEYRYIATSTDAMTSDYKTVSAANVTSVKVTLVIDENQVVKKVDVTLESETANGTTNYREQITYGKVGDAAVSAPDWYRGGDRLE